MAKAGIAAVLDDGRVPIIVGGTGMYLKTLIDGIAPVPDIDPAVRAAVRAMATADVAAALAREDVRLAARLMPGDRQRLLRGLEVVRATGRSLLDWQSVRAGGIGALHDVRCVVAEVPRPVLHVRAEDRLWAMVEAGVLDEVAALLARQLPADRPVLRALGVKEFGAVLAGEADIRAAVQAAAMATRQYQKRQATWGRSQAGTWPRIAPEAASAVSKVSRDFTFEKVNFRQVPEP